MMYYCTTQCHCWPCCNEAQSNDIAIIIIYTFKAEIHQSSFNILNLDHHDSILYSCTYIVSLLWYSSSIIWCCIYYWVCRRWAHSDTLLRCKAITMMKPKSNLAFSDEKIFRAFIYANDSGTSYIIIAVQ